jgi:hypothetical protein
MEKENQGSLEMIPPLRGGDFQGIAGLSSDVSLLVGVSTARERSFKKAPALSNIGSMSPARLSLSTVASPHCRLLFHLAGGILTAKTTKVVRGSSKPSVCHHSKGAGSKATALYFRSRENIFLDFPSPETRLGSRRWHELHSQLRSSLSK